MKRSRRLRTKLAGGIAGLGLVVALAFAVLPAIGSVGDPIPPASGLGVTPTVFDTGGQSNDCALFGGSGLSQFRIDSPKTQSYQTTVGGRTVTFALRMATGQSKDKLFDFTATNALVSYVGVKGGSDTARYDYLATRAGTSQGPVGADTNLHATLDNQGKLYNVSNVTFCFQTAANVTGSVFGDANGDGTRDSTESGIAGATVKLYTGPSFATLVATSASTTSGTYTFSGVPVAASYLVCQTSLGAAWTVTRPTSTTTGSAACPIEGTRGYTFTLTTGSSGLDFGNVELASVSGRVFDDANDNGVDDTEPGLARTVTLYRNGSSVASTTSATNGSFTFTGNPVGAGYTVCVAGSASLRQTVPTGSVNCSVEGNRGYAFTLASGGSTGNVFGFVALAAVSGRLFDDANANGTDDDEAGIGGRTVNLYRGTTLVDTATTAADGGFSFDPQAVGSSLRVCVTGVEGRVQTYPDSDTLGSAACSGTEETAVGWGFTLATGGKSDLGFGSVEAITGSCAAPFGIEPSYLIQLAGPPLGPCDKAFVIAYDDTDAENGGLASLQPVSGQGTVYAMVERITWTLPADGQQFDIRYDDILPYLTSQAIPMRYCELDPRDGTEFGLQSAFYSSDFGGNPGSVIPDYPTETSCIIEEDASTDTGKYVAYVYSSIDGLRVPNG